MGTQSYACKGLAIVGLEIRYRYHNKERGLYSTSAIPPLMSQILTARGITVTDQHSLVRADHRPPRFVTSFRPQAPMKYPAARFRTEAEIRVFKQPLLILFVPSAIRNRRGIDACLVGYVFLELVLNSFSDLGTVKEGIWVRE